MEVRRVVANDELKNDIGKVALQRGPIMYCAEWVDNFGSTSNLVIPSSANFTTEFQPALLNGITIIKSEANAVKISDNKVQTVKQPFVAIPYYAWANRGKGEMQVWLPERIKDVELLTN
jgi:DUF1680 family protein